jgi:hypothetical protein
VDAGGWLGGPGDVVDAAHRALDGGSLLRGERSALHGGPHVGHDAPRRVELRPGLERPVRQRGEADVAVDVGAEGRRARRVGARQRLAEPLGGLHGGLAGLDPGQHDAVVVGTEQLGHLRAALDLGEPA